MDDLQSSWQFCKYVTGYWHLQIWQISGLSENISDKESEANLEDINFEFLDQNQ